MAKTLMLYTSCMSNASRRVPLTKFRENFGQVVESVEHSRLPVEITRHGRVIAVIHPAPEREDPLAALMASAA